MMQPSQNNTLESARELVGSIQEKLSQLYAVAPSLDGNDTIEGLLIQCHADFKQAAEKLKHPALRIATIGTTSAGKSTLVNALIGRQIAPMDQDELSAGILHLVHNDKRHLHIKKPVEGLWDAKDESYCDDSSIYKHVRENVFKVYHRAKQERTISVPEVHIEGPLLPAAWTDLLRLPSGVGIEIYDLPGLNSIADKDNLKVIQDHLKQCFSLVVMNYSETDKKKRDKLLKEVKNVVEALGGKTDAMLFVLNGVDKRNETDDPLQQRLDDFAFAIQGGMGLSEPPKIIPTNALALFYTQCAWGWSDPNKDQPTTNATIQTELLKKFIHDCAKFTKQYQQNDIHVKNWLRGIEDALENNTSFLPSELITAENLQQWIKWTWKHTGGLNLWKELHQRVDERFAEIVIAPLLIKPLASLETLLTTLDEYTKTQRISDKDAVEKKKEELQQKFEGLQFFLEQESQEFDAEIRQNIQLISSVMTAQEINTAIDLLFGLDSMNDEPTAYELRAIVRNIKIDLTDTLIVPVRDYYGDDFVSTDELKEVLHKILSPEPRDAITRAAECYRTRYDVSINGYNGKARKGSDGEKKLKGIENAAHSLFKAMRQGLTARASYTLQTHDHSIQQALDVLLERAIINIESRIRKELPDNADALLAIYRQKRANVEFNPLPDNIFALQDIKTDELSQAEKVGVEGSCFKSDIFEDIDYITLKLPNVNEMANMWVEGVNQAETLLWDAVGKWFVRSAAEQNRLFQQSLEEARTHLLGLLNQRLEQSESEYQRKLAEIEGLDAFCHDIKTDKENLRASGNTSGANNEPIQKQ